MMMSGLSRNVVGDAGDGSIKPRLLQLSGQTGPRGQVLILCRGKWTLLEVYVHRVSLSTRGCRGSIYQELAMVTIVASLLHTRVAMHFGER
jgi:hypothetical protein